MPNRRNMSGQVNSAPKLSVQPATGLAAYAKLDDARNHVRSCLHQLCKQIAEADALDTPPRGPLGKALTNMGNELVSQLNGEAALLKRLAFPFTDELAYQHGIIAGKLRHLQRSFERGLPMTCLLDAAHEVRQCSLKYFDWFDQVFCRPPRGYG